MLNCINEILFYPIIETLWGFVVQYVAVVVDGALLGSSELIGPPIARAGLD